MKTTMDLWCEETGELVETELPARYEVCPRCEGKGTQCNLGPMTGDEYRELVDGDPDFPEDYKRGLYDVTCSECKGKRVVLVVDDDRLDPATKARVEERRTEIAQDAEDRAYQQRYGY